MKPQTRIGCSSKVTRAINHDFDYHLVVDLQGGVRLCDRDGLTLAHLSHVPDEETRESVVLFGPAGRVLHEFRGATFKVVIRSTTTLSEKAVRVGIAHLGVLSAGIGRDLEQVCSLVIPKTGIEGGS